MWPRAARLQQIRNFHPTKPRFLVNEVLDAATGFLHSVHDYSGLSWAVSIPLTALLVRTIVGLPLQIYTRVHTRRARDLQPLLAAYKAWEVFELADTKRTQQRDKNVKDTMRRMPSHLREKWNVKTFAPAVSVLQIPVWLALIEGLRGMSGMGSGLFATLFSIFKSPEETADAVNTLIEPSFASEGALWFPDLLAGDPTGVLPLILSASMILNIKTGWSAPTWREIADMPKLQMYRSFFLGGLRQFLQVIAVYIGFSAWASSMPVAVMLYWITSTNIATAQSSLLTKYLYKKPPIPSYAPKFAAFTKTGDPWRLKNH
ncbi:hypothetical protein N7495_001704 [Penicillium taxi]|uniref:uncharacterized protein n=1 Tax=Penicillium taxi TaxID=168475 RepID=UPI0025454793|nr:uncharacterized protein N7495_001704 [Penicillium taxi]KAJ5909022.1 hypothetical protein N7495_001704 [Penicillium taxi]